MSKTHLHIGGLITACGTKGNMTDNTVFVTCLRCKQSKHYEKLIKVPDPKPQAHVIDAK